MVDFKLQFYSQRFLLILIVFLKEFNLNVGCAEATFAIFCLNLVENNSLVCRMTKQNVFLAVSFSQFVCIRNFEINASDKIANKIIYSID